MTDTTPTPVDLDAVLADHAYIHRSQPTPTDTHEPLTRLVAAVPDMAAELTQLRARVATLEHVAQRNKEHVKWAVECAQRAQATQDRLYNSLCAARTDARHLADANAALGRETRLIRAGACGVLAGTKTDRDDAEKLRARVDELETAHAEAEDNFRECRQIGRDAYLHAQTLSKILAGATTTLNAIANRIATDSRDWSTQRTDAWLYALLVGWGDDALAEVAADHGWTYEQVARITILRSYVAALTEPATEDAVPARTQEPQQ